MRYETCLTLASPTEFASKLKPLKYTVRIASSTRGQTAEARRTTILQPVEGKAHSQKDRQNEKAEDFVPDEGTRETPEKQLNEVEKGNLPEKEFRKMIVKMIQDLGKEWRQRSRRCKKCLTKT